MSSRPLAVLFIAALWSSSSYAGPKTSPAGSEKANPLQSATVEAAKPLASQLRKEVATELAAVARTTVAEKVSAAAALGQAIAERDVLGAIRIGPRRPWNAGTHLTAVGIVQFDPETQTISLGGVAASLNLGALAIALSPLGETAELNTLQVHFQAAPGRHYLVDCTTNASDAMRAGAKEGEVLLTESSMSRDGHTIVFVAAAAERRNVRAIFLADREWTTGGCEVTPLRE